MNLPCYINAQKRLNNVCATVSGFFHMEVHKRVTNTTELIKNVENINNIVTNLKDLNYK